MEITIPNIKNNEQIKFADDSLTFTCLLDNNVNNHTYPRSTDAKVIMLKIYSTATDSVQVLDNIPSTILHIHL